MKMPISEMTDRYSISLLKNERIEGIDLSKELETYKQELETYSEIQSYIDKLYLINGEIWDLESDIRKWMENELWLEEIGKRAVIIRNKNKIRVWIKNEMVERYKEGFKDIKMNHISE